LKKASNSLEHRHRSPSFLNPSQKLPLMIQIARSLVTTLKT
jgi:hypothetical protein